MPYDAEDVPDDAELLARYARGDRAAARDLTLRLTPRVFAHAVRVLGDRTEAEDVTQDALMRLWRIAPDWQPGQAQVTTWLYRVTANLCTDRLRRRRRAGPPLDAVAEPPDPSPGAEERLQSQARADAVRVALAALPDRQRQAILLRHFEGLANPQIAEILEISTEAVESLTARGKRGLAAALSEQRAALGYDDE